ncbi:MAG: hypothetical protein JO110_29610 [Acetobacteraceae bacterium]|nr:hypothetical protein [Acetobacteraceae bacterium]
MAIGPVLPPLAKLLHDLGNDPALSARYAANPDTVTQEYGLPPEHVAVVKSGDKSARLLRGAASQRKGPSTFYPFL